MSHPLEMEDYFYIGEQVFPLACQWINAQVPSFGAAGGVHGMPALWHIPTACVTMLGASSDFCM